MSISRVLVYCLCIFSLCACRGGSLPFPTPAQHDLVVLIATGPLTYSVDEAGQGSGLEHDLIEQFAQELGVAVTFKPVPAEEIAERMARQEAHIAAAWLSPPKDIAMTASIPIWQSRDIIFQHEASLPLNKVQELSNKTVNVIKGSRQANDLKELAQKIPGLKIKERAETDVISLLEALGNRKLELAAIDSTLTDVANQHLPSLQGTLELGKEQAIVWWLGSNPNEELLTRLNSFLERVQLDGSLARIEDRYLGHVRRLKPTDISIFLDGIENILPRFRTHFETAQRITGVDWRLLAAVAYQESQWDPNATSPTNVRGIMMLTEETADRMGVSNRLDAAESILAGARYINLLKSQQADDVKEPDRTWLALAAYNIGPGHFNAARALARLEQANPAAWYDMKRILPLLAQSKHAQRVKSGRARGGEAVILVENIRSYYDILVRHAPPLRKTTESNGKKKAVALKLNATAPGLKYSP